MNTPFSAEIASNKSAEHLDEPSLVTVEYGPALLQLRERGCFIVAGRLYSPTLGEQVEVFYSEEDLGTPKLTASHPMSPVGPYEGIGGQHGFPRWADYHEFSLDDAPDGARRVAFQAKRSDTGPALSKLFELSQSALVITSELHNLDIDPVHTSIGEHFYFTLADERIDEVQVNGNSLDALLGDGAAQKIRDGEPFFWDGFEGDARFTFPEGYELRIASQTSENPDAKIGMLIWHRPGTESICFEPTLGFSADDGGDGLELGPYSTAQLTTTVELL